MRDDYCPSQRINLTDAEIDKRMANCPRCSKVIGIVPNRATKQATLAPHKTAAPKK